MAEITKSDIEQIIKQVISSMDGAKASASAANYTSTAYEGRQLIGIYSDMNKHIFSAVRVDADSMECVSHHCNGAAARSENIAVIGYHTDTFSKHT